MSVSALEPQWQLHGLWQVNGLWGGTGAPVQHRAQQQLPGQPVPLGALKHKGALTNPTGTVPC